MNKQLNHFDNVLNEVTGVVSKNKDETRSDENDEDQPAAKFYDLGFLHSKIIKNVFCCLTENQHIGNEYHHALPAFLVFIPGLFFLIRVFLELSLLISDAGLYILLYKTDFLSFAALLILLKVS